MATPTTTATTVFPFVSCAAESDGAHAAHVFGFAALYRAWRACRRGKRGTRKAQRYETHLLDRLVDTRDALQTHAWHPSRTTRFVTLHPKPREILAADFGDRVVHHLLVPWLERLYEPVFIHDSHANRKGRGTHAAVQRLQAFTRGQGAGHYLQLDIGNFFHSIDRRTLFGLLQGSFAAEAAPTAPCAALSVGAASAANSLLTHPNRIPMRIVTHPLHQPSAHRVGNDVAGHGADVLPIADGAVVEPSLPDRAAWRGAGTVDGRSAARLEAPHQPAQRAAAQLHQPMQVVWHEHEGQRGRQPRIVAVAQGRDGLPGVTEVRKHRVPAIHHGRQQIPAPDLRMPSRAQAVTMCRNNHASHHAAQGVAPGVGAASAANAHAPGKAPIASQTLYSQRKQLSNAERVPGSFAAEAAPTAPHSALFVGADSAANAHWECAAGPQAARTTRRPGLPPTHTVPAAGLPALRRQLMRAGQPWVEMVESGHLRNGRKRRQVQTVWGGRPTVQAQDAPTHPHADCAPAQPTFPF